MENRFLQEKITHDMSEGLLVISMSGIVETMNPAAEKILEIREEDLEGKSLADMFFVHEENDAFIQTILDAIYDTESTHHNIVGYYTGSAMKQLNITTSFMRDGDERLGVIVVLSDISELVELRDALKAMEQIKKLNAQLAMRNELISATFGRFLSDEIVKRLLDTPDGLRLGGTKKELSILMSDLRGFTALSERMAAEDLLTMLNHYLGEMTEVIQKYNGTIIEFIGDGILAIFGAPADNPRHAADCTAAALAMEMRMTAINAWNAERGYPELEMGIGVESGPVIVGNIGSERRTKYGVTGNHVNLCGRVESYTVGGQILVTEHTCALIEEEMTVESVLEVFPKGAENGLKLYDVRGIGGTYGLSYFPEHTEPQPLREPRKIEFYMIDGKHVSNAAVIGTITAVSETDGVIEADNLEKYVNIEIRPEEDSRLFAKVIDAAESGWRIRFTSKPEDFDVWLKTIRK